MARSILLTYEDGVLNYKFRVLSRIFSLGEILKVMVGGGLQW